MKNVRVFVFNAVIYRLMLVNALDYSECEHLANIDPTNICTFEGDIEKMLNESIIDVSCSYIRIFNIINDANQTNDY